jgi:hypothetical protein
MTQIHRLTNSPRGRHALRHLLTAPVSGSERDPDLLLDASAADVVDAFTGAVVVANAGHHLRRADQSYGVRILPPRSGSMLGRFVDLLAQRPQRCSIELPAGQTAPVREPRVLVPAMRVASMEEADLLALFLRATSQRSQLGDVRLEPKEARLLFYALSMLVENSLDYAPRSSCGTVVCSALESDTREVQLVVADLGTAVCKSADPLEALRDAWARSRATLGGLYYTVELGHRLGLDFSLQIRTGNAVARWRDRWHSEKAEFTPGWVASVTIHR